MSDKNSYGAASASMTNTQKIAAPTATAPAVPPDFKPVEGKQGQRLRKAAAGHVSNASPASTEIKDSTTYEDDFGKKAMKQSVLAEKLRIAAAWSTEHAKAEQWEKHAADQKHLAFDEALEALEDFRSDYENGVHHDASILTRYGALAKLYQVKAEIAQRATETKAKKKK